MKFRNPSIARISLSLATVIFALLAAPVARAVSATWNGSNDVTWATAGNWSASPVPGAGNTATFSKDSATVNGNLVLNVGTISLTSMVFDTASAAAYTLGATPGTGSITLADGTTTAVDMKSTVIANETINANLTLGTAIASTTTFSNAGSGLLTLGGILTGGVGGTAAAKTVSITGTGNTTLSGVISNGGATSLALTKSGAGTLTLTAANTFTGATNVSAGSLVLDYSQDNSKLADTGSLTLGGTLTLSGGSHTEVVGSYTLNPGALCVIRSGGTASLSGSGITRNAGSTLDVSTDGIFLTTTGSANQMLNATAGAYATVNGTDWAAKNAANTALVGFSTVGSYLPTTDTTLGGDGHSDVTSGIDTTLTGDVTGKTLRFNQSEARSLTIGTSLALGVSSNGGGILVTPNVNPASGTTTITGGTLKPGGNNALQIIQNSPMGMRIESIIADGAAASALTKSGSGTLTLTAANTFSGATYVNQGTLRLNHANALQNSTVTLPTGISNGLAFDSGVTTFNFAGLSGSGNLALTDTAAAAVTLNVGGASTTSTYSGILSGAGGSLVKVGSGTLTLGGANSFTGGLYIHAGTVADKMTQNTSITNLGAGTVYLGDIGSSAAAALQTSSDGGASGFTPNNIVVRAAAAGASLTLSQTGSVSGIYTGSVTLNHDVKLVSVDVKGINFKGAISGAGNISMESTGAGAVTLANASINNTGTIRNISGGTGSQTISGNIGALVTGVIQNSATSKLILSGTNTYDGGTTVSAGTLIAANAASLPGYAIPGKVTVTGTGVLQAQVGAGGWTTTQIDSLYLALGSGLGLNISNGNFDYAATSAVTFASITRSTGGSLRLIQDVANRFTVSSALNGSNSASGVLPWAILKTGGTIDLAVGGAAGSPVTAPGSYQTGAQSTWSATTNARPAASESQNLTNYALGSLVLDNGINIGGKVITIANGVILQTGGSSTYTANSGTAPLAWRGSVIDTEGNLTLTGSNNNSLWGGSGDVTKTGPGTLYLGAVDSFNSQQMSMGASNFHINQGLVEYSRPGGQSGWNDGSAGAIVFNGGNLTVHAGDNRDGNSSKNKPLIFNADTTWTIDNAQTGSNLGAGTNTALGYLGTVAHSVTFNPVTVTVAGGAHVSSGTAGLMLGTVGGTGHTVTLNGTPTLNITQPSAGGATMLTLNGVIGDGGKGYGLTKSGDGTLTLGGANSYTGATTVSHGTLVLASGSGTSPIIVGGSAVLGFVPGSSITSTSSVTLVSGAKIRITVPPVAPNNYVLITASGGISGTPVPDAAITGYALVKDGNSIQLNYTGSGGGFSSWMGALVTGGYTGDQTPGGDSDNDGIQNLMEYVFNGQPGISDLAILPDPSVTSTDFVFTFTRRVESAADTTQVFEYGSDLVGWTPVNITPPTGTQVALGTPTGGTPNLQSVTVTIPRASNTQLFGRLKVTQP